MGGVKTERVFPGTVLPFCYFSVVRKVPEKPVLFLPHPMKNRQSYQNDKQFVKDLSIQQWTFAKQLCRGNRTLPKIFFDWFKPTLLVR
jgi:hypothetical protein